MGMWQRLRRERREELRIAELRIESQRDQLDAAWLDHKASVTSVVDEVSATAFITRSKTLWARHRALMELFDVAERLRIHTINGVV